MLTKENADNYNDDIEWKFCALRGVYKCKQNFFLTDNAQDVD